MKFKSLSEKEQLIRTGFCRDEEESGMTKTAKSMNQRERFEVLMQQANITEQVHAPFAKDGIIEQVICSEDNRLWTICLAKQELVPQSIYRIFCKQIQDKFAHIAKIHFTINYSEQVTHAELANEYWTLFLDWIQREMASVNGWIAKANIQVNEQTIDVQLLDAYGIELLKKKKIDEQIIHFFQTFFSRTYHVKFSLNEQRTDEFARFQEQIDAESREETAAAIQQAIESSASIVDEEDRSPLLFGYEIKDIPVPIRNVQEEERRVTIQGTILRLDQKELRNGSTLFQFILTDFTDSLSIKCFTRSKEDLLELKKLANGKWVKLRGRVEFDKFLPEPELTLMPNDINEVLPPKERTDEAAEKRVEFHLHTSLSAMDAVTPVEEYIKTAAKWGHDAIAITDHAGVQVFPEAYYAAKKHEMKVIYGVEANVIHDAIPIVMNARAVPLSEAEYVVFDIETTGLSVTQNKIIEIAAVKMVHGEEIDRYTSFVNPHEKIPYNITKLTNITDQMVVDAPDIEQVLPEFVEFCGEAVLVAHNATFDLGFVQANCTKLGLEEMNNPVLDTLELARLLYPTMRNHRLNTLSDRLKVSLENHHRAIDDTLALVEILKHLLKDAADKNITALDRVNDYVGKDLTNVRPFHCCIYAKNEVGKKNLFKLISLSHTQYFHRVARIPKSKLIEYREGLIIASGCEQGEFFSAILNKTEDEAEEIAQFYDVLEVQPIGTYKHLLDKGLVGSLEQLKEANRKVCAIGEQLNKPVIATGNVHYLHPRDKVYRDITIHGITGFSPLKDIEKPDVHFRTTNEMLAEFAHLGDELAYKVVVENTRKLAEQFSEIEMFPSEPFFPEVEGADKEIRETCYKTAVSFYGDPLPEVVTERLEKELNPIIQFGFAALYLISERLVKKSNEDGYLVGSRGSVGSSIVAMMLGISEVNPLPPHYVCQSCKHSEWFTDGSVRSGFDLDNKSCPTCGEQMRGDGQDIPFETFLGFKGDKVPDIDLNFSGDYQPIAHNYTKELFGEENVFRAGTIGTVAEKTAFGFVKKYEEDHAQSWRTAEVLRLASGCTGVKRSTGQHPGGIVVIPDHIDIEEITPVQYPADDTSAEWKTTHFDYHAYDENLLKLDILGHDDPTMMRMLHDLTAVDPTTIPMNDPLVMSVFNSTDALGVTSEQIRSKVGTYGIPEMGTRFVRQMLEETKPATFADLLQISGLSHGSGVWLGNAQELIKNGQCTIKTVIGCRDDIMLYLIYQGGLDASLAFTITESVRRGRGLTDEWIQVMKEHGIPDWYIQSCMKIEYMFPKAHASAYVISAVRCAYYKIYHPIAFYSTYFTVRGEDLDVDLCCQGYDAIFKRIQEIEAKGFQALPKERSMLPILEMALEMTARGFSFQGLDLYRSQANEYVIDGDTLIPPFSALSGVGVNAAKNIAVSRDGDPFLSIEDFQQRAKVSKTVIDLLREMGCFRGLPESNQLSLF